MEISKRKAHSYVYTLLKTLDHTEIFAFEKKKKNWPYSISLARYMCAFLERESETWRQSIIINGNHYIFIIFMQ